MRYSCACLAVDISGHLVTQMLKDMPPIMHLPKSAAELKTLLLSTGESK